MHFLNLGLNALDYDLFLILKELVLINSISKIQNLKQVLKIWSSSGLLEQAST